jgi:transcription initiation factor TFIIF subunit beta
MRESNNVVEFPNFKGYLKEVLKDICVYCVKNPHKNMWELKPEYRHYKAPVEDADADDDDDD